MLPMLTQAGELRVASAMEKVRELAQAYSVASGGSAPPVQRWFLLDTLGCHLREAASSTSAGVGVGGEEECNVILSPAFVDVRTGFACSMLFPIRDMEEGELARLPSRSRASLAPPKSK